MIDNAIRWFEGDILVAPRAFRGKDTSVKSFGDMVKQAQKMKKQMSELQDQFAEERYPAQRRRRRGDRGGGWQADAQESRRSAPRP